MNRNVFIILIALGLFICNQANAQKETLDYKKYAAFLHVNKKCTYYDSILSSENQLKLNDYLLSKIHQKSRSINFEEQYSFTESSKNILEDDVYQLKLKQINDLNIQKSLIKGDINNQSLSGIFLYNKNKRKTIESK